MMIRLCVRMGDSAACFIHTMDVSVQGTIRKNTTTVLLSQGVTLLILTEAIRFFSAQCHRIDVVSGCGKNVEGAAQPLSLVFHNLSQKLLTLSLPQLAFPLAMNELG